MSHSGLTAHITRRYFLQGLGLLSASAALSACSKPAGDDSAKPAGAVPLLAIIHTNDTHGHDVEVETTEDAEGNFSMAAVAALKREWEAKGYEVLLVDAGDATQGMPLVDVNNGESAIAFMNSCGYDLMAVGNHEFDWGPDNLLKIEKQANFPLVSANVLYKENGEQRFGPSVTCELSSGALVGFFGLTTPATLTTTSPKNVSDFTFLREDELFACAQGQVDDLRSQGCDLVVCVGHLGNETAVGKNTSRDVLNNVKGIDLFIDGHDHQLVEEEVAGALLVETGCYLHNIGLVVIDEGVPANQSVAYGAFEGIDEPTQTIIDEENARVEKELGVVLGETAFLLNGERDPGVRTQETNLGDFCADAFKWTAEQELEHEIDAAVLGGGGIRISVEPGDISLKTLKTIMPFSNNVQVIDITGAQLLEALEAACQGIGTGDALGAFPQVAGITFTLDAATPFAEGPLYPDSTYASPADPGARVTITDVGGKGFDLDETYTLASTDFLCIGGDTYHAFKEAAEAGDPVVLGLDYEALSSYLIAGCDHKVPDEYEEPQGRITIIGL